MRNENWDIVAKYLSKEDLNKEETEIINSLFTEEESSSIIRQSEKLYQKTDLYFGYKKFDSDKSWNKLNDHLKKSGKKIALNWFLRSAAIILFLITTSIAVWQFRSIDKTLIEYSTASNEFSKPEILLPDGTRATLNHSSKITYPRKFNGRTREITLSGEAFFEVTPNAEKPFIIKTTKASVKVLGTSFNVYAYNNVPIVEVAVKTGKVELFSNLPTSESQLKKLILLPGEKGNLDKTTQILSKNNILNNNHMAWLTNSIEFEYAKLPEVIGTLKRAFNVDITIDNAVDLNQQLSATFNQQKPDYILDVVALTLNLRIEKTENNCYIIKNN